MGNAAVNRRSARSGRVRPLRYRPRQAGSAGPARVAPEYMDARLSPFRDRAGSAVRTPQSVVGCRLAWSSIEPSKAIPMMFATPCTK
jgi:hypothetical protein